jgi:uncharacterized membrane protein YbjE (DUF340 family)
MVKLHVQLRGVCLRRCVHYLTWSVYSSVMTKGMTNVRIDQLVQKYSAIVCPKGPFFFVIRCVQSLI